MDLSIFQHHEKMECTTNMIITRSPKIVADVMAQDQIQNIWAVVNVEIALRVFSEEDCMSESLFDSLVYSVEQRVYGQTL